MRAVLLCLAFLSLAANEASVAAEQPSTWQGRRLSAYLEMLNQSGQRIIFSSDLVRDDMRFSVDPGPDAGLREILKPFGLTVREGPDENLLVVRAAATGRAAALSSPEDQAIPEIVVSSSLYRLEYARPYTHTYLDRDIVTRLPVTAGEAVRVTQRLPGTASGGVSSRSHVRGGEAGETLFLLDGVRLYEPYHLKDFQSIATIVNSNAISGMEFYTGAYPARFGDRMSGVLDMDLREPEESRQTEVALSFFNLSLLSFGEFGDGGGDWLIAGRRGNLDLVIDALDPERGDPAYQDYLGHVRWQFGPLADISANLLVSDDKISLNDPDRGERADAAYRNRIGWLKWYARWSKVLTSESMLSISDIDNVREGELELPGIVSGMLDESRAFTAIDFRQEWQWQASPHWMLHAGYGVKYLEADYRYDAHRSVEPPFDDLFDNQPSGEASSRLSPSGRQYGAYTEFRWQPVYEWTMELGLRWDRQDYTLATGDRQYSPRATLLYRPGERTEIRIGWGQYYQAQEINELQVSDGVEAYFPAQHAEHFVINAQHRLASGIDLGLSLYRKSFRSLRPRFENVLNTLTLLPEIQFDRLRIDPSGAEAYGAELTLSGGSPEDTLIWWFSYTWSRALDELPDGEVKRSWDQTHTVKGGASWRWKQWDFSMAAEAHTGWPKTLLLSEPVMAPDGSPSLMLQKTDRNSLRYTVFHTVDVRVSRSVDVPTGDLTLFLEVTNIYDRSNPCCTEYGLRPDGSLESREAHWLPLVPSLGVVWRF